MSAIAAANLSATNAIASLLSNAASAATGAGTSATNATTSGSSASNPADIVDLSDHAKAVLAQAQKDQVAASELQAFVQSNRNPGGTGQNSIPSQSTPSQSTQAQAAGNVTQAFDQLTGQAPSQQQGGAAPTSLAGYQLAGGGTLAGLGDYAVAVANANRQPDGTVKNYSQAFSDVIAVPSTPQEIAAWYQNEGRAVLMAAQYWPQDYPPGLAQAITSHSVSFLNANDIPGLNFHNTITIQGGEGGSGNGEVYTYNHNAAIFSDPTTSYQVSADGTVLSWKTPPASGTAASVE